MTKRKAGVVALLMAGIVLVSAVITFFTGVSHRGSEERLRVVASFYPVYIAALNVTDGVQGIQLESLAGPQTGCLHDYQLSPDNLIALEGADVLLISGAGAEAFLDDTLSALPALPVVDLSQGVDLLASDAAHGHDHDHGGEEEVLYNEHIWTSPQRYAQQVRNLCDGLCRLDPEYASAYQANTEEYLSRIDEVSAQLKETAALLPDTDCVIFHESLAYLAQDLGLHVAAVIPIGEDQPVSASQLAQAEQAIRADRPLWLLYDAQYPLDDYDYLGQKARVSQKLTLDTAVQGETDKNAWLDAMQDNLQQLQTAAGTEGEP